MFSDLFLRLRINRFVEFKNKSISHTSDRPIGEPVDLEEAVDVGEFAYRFILALDKQVKETLVARAIQVDRTIRKLVLCRRTHLVIDDWEGIASGTAETNRRLRSLNDTSSLQHVRGSFFAVFRLSLISPFRTFRAQFSLALMRWRSDWVSPPPKIQRRQAKKARGRIKFADGSSYRRAISSFL